MCKQTLKEYHKSKHWRDFRKPILWNEKDLVCEICGKRRWKRLKNGEISKAKSGRANFNIHHKHYRTMYHEKRSDVMALCSRCHSMGHELHKSVGTKIFKELYEKFCKETGWEHESYPKMKKQKYTNKKATR